MFLLEKVMRERGISRTRLGFLTEIHPATIGKLLAGHIPPYPNYRRKIARALNVPEEILFREERVGGETSGT